MPYLFLIFLGIITYLIIKVSVTRITRTPVILLWVVMMTPALTWATWMLINGQDSTVPWQVIVVPFLICPILYWLLIQWGRTPTPNKLEKSNLQSSSDSEETEDSEEKQPQLRPITPKEEKLLRNCFPWEVYYLQNLDYRPQAILCRGKLRTNPDVAYDTIDSNVKGKFGDRFFVIFQEGLQDQPFFALVPNPRFQSTTTNDRERESDTPRQIGFALGFLLITILISTLIGIEIAIYPVEELSFEPQVLQQGLVYSLALLGIFSARELSHYLMAVHYKIRTTLPYFIPVPFFPGTIGAFIQKRSPIPNRKVLFDIAVSGPIAGLIVSIPILIWGLSLSETVEIAENSRLLSLEALNPRFSIFLALLSKFALGSQLTAETAIDLHPLAVAGYVGLGLTTLNLIPIGQLDGGQIIHAVFGKRTAIAIAQIARLFMFILVWIQPDFWVLAIMMLFMPIIDEPALNDVSQLDNGRDLLGLLSLGILLMVILPAPNVMVQWLNL